MDEVAVVTVFLRHRGEVLLLRRSAEVDSYPSRWGTVAGHVEHDAPLATARSEIEEETGLQESEVTLVTEGPTLSVDDADRGTRWHVHPFLFDTNTRDISTHWETDTAEWAAPTALLRRDTVPELWTSYRRVAPSVVDLTDDTTHGSAYLSVRALEVLRDRAGQLATAEPNDIEDTRARLLRTADRLLDARPTMAALANRIHRVLYASRPDLAPPTVETNAHEAIGQAYDAEADAAQEAAARVSGQRVLTLSRSGTVHRALRHGAPDAVVVATSHPGGEGIGVAERLAEREQDVSLIPDAAVPAALADRDIDLVLVGADTVHPSGAVVNKVGTRGAALAARHEDVPVHVACSIDKVAPTPSPPSEAVPRHDVYDGPAPLQVWAPRFDITPPTLVTGGFATERGQHSADAVASIAEELDQLREWQ
jgi:translation initiation factor 2B subunit (eIF-2B alpha/beta/delta family)